MIVCCLFGAVSWHVTMLWGCWMEEGATKNLQQGCGGSGWPKNPLGNAVWASRTGHMHSRGERELGVFLSEKMSE